MSHSAKLGFFAIVSMTLISVANLRNLPMLADMGYPFFFYVTAAALFFLVPASFASSFLSSLFPADVGGVYLWVSRAFSKKTGLIAIWLQWIENVFYYPILLTFITENIVTMFMPQFAGNAFFTACFVPFLFFIMTWVNYRGISLSVWVTEACTWIGLILPFSLIVFLGISFLYSQPDVFPSVSALIPTSMTDVNNLTPAIVIFCGIEIATVHAADVKDAKRIYPLAILSSSVVIYLIMIVGTMTVLFYSSGEQVNALTGLVQFFQVAIGVDSGHWSISLLMISILFGMIGVLNNWIISPTRGLQAAFIDNNCMKSWVENSPAQTPVKLLWLQFMIVVVLSVVYMFLPVGTVYSLLNILLVLLYMPMYVLLFLSAIRLRNLAGQGDVPFSPGFIYAVSLIGVISTLVVMASYVIKPSEFASFSYMSYLAMIIIPFIICVIPAFLLGKNND